MGKGHRHRRGVVRFGLDPRLCARAAPRAALAGRSLSRRLGPAPRLVSVLADRGLRDARPRALRGRADARLRARRRRAQDVEIARQCHSAAADHAAERGRHPAPLGGRLGLHRGCPHRPGDPQAPQRRLPPIAQHAALPVGCARRLYRRRGGRHRGDARARPLGIAPPGRARRSRPAFGRGIRFPRHVRGIAQFLCDRFVGLLFRHPQGPALLRCAGRCAAARGADRARPVLRLSGALAGPGHLLHRGGGLARPPRRRCRDGAFISSSSPMCRRVGATTRSASAGRYCAICAASSPAHWNWSAGQSGWGRACRPPSSCSSRERLADQLRDVDLAELCITSAGTVRLGTGTRGCLHASRCSGSRRAGLAGAGGALRALLEGVARGRPRAGSRRSLPAVR